MKNQVQLITYVDRFGGPDIRALQRYLTGPLNGVFGAVHLLPFFYPFDGADAGFDPIDHRQVDPRLGQWQDIRALSKAVDVMADLIVNHISADSPQFQDLLAKGSASTYEGLFLNLDLVFPQGAREADLLSIYRPRPGLPFTAYSLRDGRKCLFWTTFTSKQIDINVFHPEGRSYLRQILNTFREAGISMVRIDAAGYAVKTPGTSCFMTEDTYAFIESLSSEAKSLGIEVLVEIHAYYQQQIKIAQRVDWVYDFALPPLILHSLFFGNGTALKSWLAISPRNAITVLDTHDGIGIVDIGAGALPEEAQGLISPTEIDALVEQIHANSRGTSQQATGAAASNLDLYQVNCTFYEALGKNDQAYLLARLIQFFVPGIPQVYYAGLLAAENDMALLASTQVGRDINRPYFSPEALNNALQKPVVQALIDLIRFRNQHPAFAGSFSLLPGTAHSLDFRWEQGVNWAELHLDLRTHTFRLSYSDGPQSRKVDNRFQFPINAFNLSSSP